MTTYCFCESPVIDVDFDAGCRRCGLPVDFGPREPGSGFLCSVCGYETLASNDVELHGVHYHALCWNDLRWSG